jgi:glutamine amidotransferase
MAIDIIDVGSGNIKSVENLVSYLNIKLQVVRKPSEINSNLIILPGVGSVGPYMERMKKLKFDQAVLEHIAAGRRLLGICLGFQIMGESSEEDGGVECLGLIKGVVEKMETNNSHNGWENFKIITTDLSEQLFQSEQKLTRKRTINGRVFYNHEYGFISKDNSVYDKKISKQYSKYSAMIVKDKIIGIQFHPEKSQQTGLQLISMIL